MFLNIFINNFKVHLFIMLAMLVPVCGIRKL